MTGRRGRKCRKLLDVLKERRGYSQLKEEALDRTVWRARFGRGFGPIVRQTNELINSWWTQSFQTRGKSANCQRRVYVASYAVTHCLIPSHLVTLHVSGSKYFPVFPPLNDINPCLLLMKLKHKFYELNSVGRFEPLHNCCLSRIW